MGDFNVDLLRDSVASRSLIEHFESLSLSVVNREPINFQSVCDPTFIDLFVTNSSEDVDVFTQIDLSSCKTIHDLIYGSKRFPDVGSRSVKSFFILGTIHRWLCIVLYRMWMSLIRLQFIGHPVSTNR
jgi:hypothetical protein